MKHGNNTIIAIADNTSGVITAFYRDYPGLVVQGTDNKDVINKLDKLMDAFIAKLDALRQNLVINPVSY